MALPELRDHQRALAESPNERKVFLYGPAGTGKTTTGIARMLHLLDSGVASRSLLVLVAQRTLSEGYRAALEQPERQAGTQVMVSTLAGLAQRMVDLFWPIVAEEAGFAYPQRPPVFLTAETAQYYMARLVRPLLEAGYFETVVLDRNRIYAQILDYLSKASAVGFPYTEAAARMKQAWSGESSHLRVYDEAQACANRFRRYCLDHNLLDFSLQIEVFRRHLWPLPMCRDYLISTHTHLIIDNVEEEVPVSHDIFLDWLQHCRSALVIADADGGYRGFMGADPHSALRLRDACDEQVTFSESFTTSADLRALAHRFGIAMQRQSEAPEAAISGDPQRALTYAHHRYHPEMLDWVADSVADLVQTQGVPPAQIAVLSPYLPDALRFALADRLARRGIPSRSHRPSRALREEPATRCLLTLSALAHPEWGVCPSRYEVAYALMQAIHGLDLVRAQLLAEIVYRVQDGRPSLSAFEQIQPAMQERVTYVLGARYDHLREALALHAQREHDDGAFDHFLGRLFGETLSQPGFGFQEGYDAGAVTARLIASVRSFRLMASYADEATDPAARRPLGQEYIEMVQEGVLAAQYLHDWWRQPEPAILLAPAHTFLVSNQSVDYQFWLDVGSPSWWDRLNQPLTQAYVLTRQWPSEAVWTEQDETETRDNALYRLVLGLIRRCRRRIYLGLTDLSEHGRDQRGVLVLLLQRILRAGAVEVAR